MHQIVRTVLGATALALLCAANAPAQTYPSKPVRIIVPFPPGGGVDFMGRLLATELSKSLGQQVIVDNRPGAGSTLGTEIGLRAAPDGYTLVLISASYPVNPALYKLNFDPVNDITPIILAAKGPFMVVVNPALPVKTTRDLIALAKAKPDQLNYASSGQGTIIHLATALFADMAGIRMTHIPYKGTGQAMTDTVAGQTQVMLPSITVAQPLVKTGRLRAIAVTTATRIPAEPNIPAVAETIKGYETFMWQGLIGPKGLPRPIVDRLNTEITKVLQTKEMEDRLATDGVSPSSGPPEQFHALIRKEIAQWDKIVKASGVKVE
jgi:tripartite-type tricarboxylate transporter receptor subunit TctC